MQCDVLSQTAAQKMEWEKRDGRDDMVVCPLVCTVHLIRVSVYQFKLQKFKMLGYSYKTEGI